MCNVKGYNLQFPENPLPQNQLDNIEVGNKIFARSGETLPFDFSVIVEKVTQDSIYGFIEKTFEAGTSRAADELMKMKYILIPKNAIYAINSSV